MKSFPRNVSSYRDLFARRFRWDAWDAVIDARGITVERPERTVHPEYPEVVYPLDYGYVNATWASDGDAVDCFVGSVGADDVNDRRTGLVGAILTVDHRREDREVKLLYRCTPPEIYTAHGFINYDRTLLQGLLVLRHPMHSLWS